MKPIDFITLIAPIAIKLRLEGSPIFPSLRIAQAAHETGWVIHKWNNLVGYKVGPGKPNQFWDGSSVNTKTWEEINGQRVNTSANWRAYKTIEDCFRDQDLLFGNSRYARVQFAKTPEEQAQMLKQCGYATDSIYDVQIIKKINDHGLKKYDAEVENVLAELQKQIAEQNKRLADQEKRIKALEGKAKMDSIPEWAKPAVDAAVKSEILAEPEGGSYDFYRFITVMHRKGLI